MHNAHSEAGRQAGRAGRQAGRQAGNCGQPGGYDGKHRRSVVGRSEGFGYRQSP